MRYRPTSALPLSQRASNRARWQRVALRIGLGVTLGAAPVHAQSKPQKPPTATKPPKAPAKPPAATPATPAATKAPATPVSPKNAAPSSAQPEGPATSPASEKTPPVQAPASTLSTEPLNAPASIASPAGATATPPAAQPAAPRRPSPNAGKKLVVERVVAVVNNAIIMQSELDARMLPMLAETENIADPKERARRRHKLTGQVLEEMVSEQLIVEAAEGAKIEVEADDVNATIEDIKKQNNLDDDGLAKALAQQGYSLSSYRADLRKQILRLRAINQLVRPKVNVSDEDVRARYDSMMRRSDATAAVRLSHMLFRLPEHATEQQQASARERAAAALARVRGGEAFATVAAEVSDDEGTKNTGGELGWFERGSISMPEWESVIFAMEKGDTRGPVRGPQGFHIFSVTEIKRSDNKAFDEVKEQLRGELMRRAMDKQTQVWIEELRRKAYIDTRLES